MKVLICGDRNWDDLKAIQRWVDGLPPDATVVHGGARGADMMVHKAIILRNNTGSHIRLIVYTAHWEKYGRAAGPIRNQQMLDKEPDLDRVFAFHNNLGESKGTKDMVSRARKRGILVEVIGEGS